MEVAMVMAMPTRGEDGSGGTGRHTLGWKGRRWQRAVRLRAGGRLDPLSVARANETKLEEVRYLGILGPVGVGRRLLVTRLLPRSTKHGSCCWSRGLCLV